MSISFLKTIKCKKLGMFWKIQEFCSKMGTKIFQIDGEMPKIIEIKVGNPQISIIRK